jgi:hypothetical protein
MTRFRIGLTLGFATGYYFGTKAGRERYFQIRRTVATLRRSGPLGTAVGKASAVVHLGKERAHLSGSLVHDPVIDLPAGYTRN